MEEKLINILREIIKPQTEKIIDFITRENKELKELILKQNEEIHSMRLRLDKMENGSKDIHNTTTHSDKSFFLTKNKKKYIKKK